MGANSSKAGTSTVPDGSNIYVWKSDTPVTLSHSLSESLSSSNETDSSRAKALESQIQARVKAELERLRKEETENFKKVAEKLSTDDQSESEPSAGDKLRALSRDVVQQEVSELRKKLESRKKLADVDADVEQARGAVIQCLRDHDRRPLDCWKEVETFRREVKRLEDKWVDKVIS